LAPPSFPTRRSSDLPAEVHLAVVADRREVDEPAVEVAQDDLAPGELPDAGLELDERLAHPLAEPPAAVRRGALHQLPARLVVGRSEEHTSELQSRFD